MRRDRKEAKKGLEGKKKKDKGSRPGRSLLSEAVLFTRDTGALFSLDISNYGGVFGGSAIGQDARVSKEGDPRRSVYVRKGHLRANEVMLIPVFSS